MIEGSLVTKYVSIPENAITGKHKDEERDNSWANAVKVIALGPRQEITVFALVEPNRDIYL